MSYIQKLYDFIKLNKLKKLSQMKNSLLIALIIIAIAMIIIGISAKIVPPVLTSLGFIIIAFLFYKKNI